ncbi:MULTISPECIES: L,D-transpeptidase family protein [unclassified Romboutsia]|uniref:L,D-transpeptidase family protein n=1 Tax=unclassified Romboutsia TaxID=2626894 RepID=UPI00189B6ED0|nr:MULTISPECIES: L,D-transpeptidase [unclassified Romboutsia]MDB8790250.1 L,D-transpeptidase [Romboutsia sp. 1001216sp1]MDB8802573.1 L,D-transpeptidase [Romboutsia sp. 1001216sp1]MDB8805628.1 L,D-transpeptidase [Romboutsia sp. 1001216sp1]MDB8808664.1 L,D-transpeptidase [Romboutsia sp. 1001216sp1]MDB8811103.1 L,D-transpeptidase [Romboutsia sp. 1001216sp1]
MNRYYRQIDYSKFDKNMEEFVNENHIKSDTGYIIITSTKDKLTYILKKVDDRFKVLHVWSSTVGKSSTPTIKGIFKSGIKYPAIGGEKSSAKYAMNIVDDYYYHSILYDPKGLYVIDDRLGVAISMGCIRLATENARWMYDNIPINTTIIIK